MKTKILFLALISLFAASCVTQRRCYTKFPPARDTIKIVTIRDSIIYRDTTIYIELPGETVIDSIFIPCPEVPGYVPKKVYAETELARASAWWSFPVIKLELIQKDTTIARRLENALKDAYHWQSEYQKITVTPQPVKYIPKIYKQALSICIFIFACAFSFIGWKLYKFIKK